jgi:hypothetical protein
VIAMASETHNWHATVAAGAVLAADEALKITTLDSGFDYVEAAPRGERAVGLAVDEPPPDASVPRTGIHPPRPSSGFTSCVEFRYARVNGSA